MLRSNDPGIGLNPGGGRLGIFGQASAKVTAQRVYAKHRLRTEPGEFVSKSLNFSSLSSEIDEAFVIGMLTDIMVMLMIIAFLFSTLILDKVLRFIYSHSIRIVPKFSFFIQHTFNFSSNCSRLLTAEWLLFTSTIALVMGGSCVRSTYLRLFLIFSSFPFVSANMVLPASVEALFVISVFCLIFAALYLLHRGCIAVRRNRGTIEERMPLLGRMYPTYDPEDPIVPQAEPVVNNARAAQPPPMVEVVQQEVVADAPAQAAPEAREAPVNAVPVEPAEAPQPAMERHPDSCCSCYVLTIAATRDNPHRFADRRFALQCARDDIFHPLCVHCAARIAVEQIPRSEMLDVACPICRVVTPTDRRFINRARDYPLNPHRQEDVMVPRVQIAHREPVARVEPPAPPADGHDMGHAQPVEPVPEEGARIHYVNIYTLENYVTQVYLSILETLFTFMLFFLTLHSYTLYLVIMLSTAIIIRMVTSSKFFVGDICVFCIVSCARILLSFSDPLLSVLACMFVEILVGVFFYCACILLNYRIPAQFSPSGRYVSMVRFLWRLFHVVNRRINMGVDPFSPPLRFCGHPIPLMMPDEPEERLYALSRRYGGYYQSRCVNMTAAEWVIGRRAGSNVANAQLLNYITSDLSQGVRGEDNIDGLVGIALHDTTAYVYQEIIFLRELDSARNIGTQNGIANLRY